MYRGIIHFHSQFSYDSTLSIKKIVSFALAEKLTFLILTDHDTIDGSIALKDYIKEKKYPIEVVVGAEYNTEYGDIIAINIQQEIEEMRFDKFINNVKEQGGTLLFPHPYKGHKNIETIIKYVDLVEVFNSRTDDKSNNKALKLALEHNKPIYFATDSHNYRSLKNSIIEFEVKDDLINSLLNSRIVDVTKDKSYYWEIFLSQYIKFYKQKNIKLFLLLCLKTFKSIVLFKFFRKI